MKHRLNVPKGRPLADFLPTVTLLAKSLATEITNVNVEHHDLSGEKAITEEHVKNNDAVRKTLLDRGIQPEKLAPAEDIKKVKRRHQKGIKDAGKQKLNPPHEDE